MKGQNCLLTDLSNLKIIRYDMLIISKICPAFQNIFEQNSNNLRIAFSPENMCAIFKFIFLHSTFLKISFESVVTEINLLQKTNSSPRKNSRICLPATTSKKIFIFETSSEIKTSYNFVLIVATNTYKAPALH